MTRLENSCWKESQPSLKANFSDSSFPDSFHFPRWCLWVGLSLSSFTGPGWWTRICSGHLGPGWGSGAKHTVGLLTTLAAVQWTLQCTACNGIMIYCRNKEQSTCSLWRNSQRARSLCTQLIWTVFWNPWNERTPGKGALNGRTQWVKPQSKPHHVSVLIVDLTSPPFPLTPILEIFFFLYCGRNPFIWGQSIDWLIRKVN